MFKNFTIIICGAALISSCTTSKELHKKTVTDTEKASSSIDAIDTSKTTTVTEASTTTNYGDTLRGSLYFDDSAYQTAPANDYFTDSLESNGVKVSVSLVKTKNGIKAKVKAIAKPAAIKDFNRVTTTENKGVAVKTIATVEKKSEASSKDVKKKTSWLGFGLIGLGILVLLGWYIIKKYKILLWLKGS